ncbi:MULTISPECIES: sensor domain-containing protein [Thiorhodovibrio]|uniref:sensor domain-containing protein n=1 Tax=Thiorhodovibrio TaxID=61593 RepID=UPI0019122BB0|nr:MULTISPECIES: EAL domain-containing protein [Thiorhodovibrio]MBK5970710.1 diguanylate cyclase [Thiorhodovibrio winogradskyi]WPL14255.1 Cyclic di-GMP phosphodiesterase Gmr [Thiorhodovibrio litoralis]
MASPPSQSPTASHRANEQRFRTLVEVNQVAIMELDTQGRFRYANPAACRMLGYTHERLVQMEVADLLPAEEAEQLHRDMAYFVAEQPEPFTYTNHNRTGDGRWIEVQVDWNYLRDDSGAVIGFVSISSDITAFRLSQRLLDGRNAVLEQLARGAPLEEMLRAIVDYSQDIMRDAWISIHLLDAECGQLHSAISSRLPSSYLQAVEGVRIGPNVGSCGHAAFTGERTIASDLRSDPKWDGYRDLVLPLGLLACWSEPILGRDGQVLGTFAIYLPDARAPEPADLQLIASAAELASIVIEHQEDANARKVAEERAQLLLNSTVEGIFGIDLDERISFANPSTARLLGGSAEALTTADLIGRDPHALFHYANAAGEPLPRSECRMLRAAREACQQHVSDEVFWRLDGSAFPVEYWAMPVYHDGRVTGAVVTFHDISERRRAEREIEHLAFHDPLTGLPNRALFRETLSHAHANFLRQGRPFALHMLDLDHFKDVNDTLGHPVGDQLLCAVGARITDLLRASDTLARLGGDEFALLQENIQTSDDAARLASKIIEALNQEFHIDQHPLRINTSIGILIASRDDSNVDEMIGRADAALYRAKAAGRGTLAFFESELARHLQQEMEIVNALSEALQQERIQVYYQPQFNLADASLVGIEALMRWDHPTRGMLKPAEFFAVADKRGLLRDLANAAMMQACKQAGAWRDAGLDYNQIAVNLCARQLNHPHFVTDTKRILETTGVAPESLTLELTESLLSQADDHAQQKLRELAELGVQFAVDDFGSGFSSLRHLSDLPVAKLKLDRSLVTSLPEQRDAAEIVKASIALGKALNFTILAEGVETPSQAEFLHAHGCDQAQGFFYAVPAAASTIEKDWLRRPAP